MKDSLNIPNNIESSLKDIDTCNDNEVLKNNMQYRLQSIY